MIDFTPPSWVDEQMVALDFETSGELPEYALQPWRLAQGKFWATSLSAMHYDAGRLHRRGGLFPTVETMREVLEDAIAHKRTIICWNALFDISVLLAYGLEDLVFQLDWLDGMLLWRHLFIEPEYDLDRSKKKSYGLKTAVAEFLPQHAGYEEDVDFHSTDPEALKKLQQYNDRDTAFTWAITKHLHQALTAEQLSAAWTEAACLPLVAQSNLQGIPVDTVATKGLSCRLQAQAQAMLDKLAPHGVTEVIARSPTKLGALLFDPVDKGGWALPVFKENTSAKTQKVSRSTDKEVLHELSFQDPRAKDLQTYRESLNQETKFAKAPMASVDYNGDGNTHPLAIVFGTYSGRMTYASKQGKNKDTRQIGFALHQEKREKYFREILIAPPGHSILEFDAAAQEIRWMAIASEDPNMLAMCQPGEDIHSFMGARISERDYQDLVDKFKVDEPKAVQDRYAGKFANLSCQYRISARKLRSKARVDYGIPLELPEAQRIHRIYPQTYRRVPIYWEQQIRLVRQLGYVETFAGRRVQVIGDWETRDWQMGSTSINYRIQGTGADQKYLALRVLRPLLRDLGVRFGWDLHDGLYFFVPDEHLDRAARTFKPILDNLPYKEAWGFTPPIPMPWDGKQGKSWGALKDIKYD